MHGCDLHVWQEERSAISGFLIATSRRRGCGYGLHGALESTSTEFQLNSNEAEEFMVSAVTNAVKGFVDKSDAGMHAWFTVGVDSFDDTSSAEYETTFAEDGSNRSTSTGMCMRMCMCMCHHLPSL